MEQLFNPTEVQKVCFTDSIPARNRGRVISLDEAGVNRSLYINDAKVHDANFAFLSTALAKLHEKPYEPKHNATYSRDIPINVGGGFVDYVSYFTVDWAGIMNEFRNVMGNNANIIPRVNAGLSKKQVNVYTWEVAYDLRFVELEKMNQLNLQKSIEDIYKNAILAGWDLFVQKVAYTGINGATGFFNDANVYTQTVTNTGTTGKGFAGLTDGAVVAFFNGVFETYLQNSNMNVSILPDTFLVPTFVGADLSGRFSTLYTATLREFIAKHNLAMDESDGDVKVRIESRPALNTLGTGSHGRIVAYRKDEDYVRIDMPYPMQHYITLPNIDKMSYTSAFVGQVSQVQLPYNAAASELGVVSYWDFSTEA